MTDYPPSRAGHSLGHAITDGGYPPQPTPKVVRSGFADEISSDLETQLDVLTELGIDRMDLRSVWETNVLDLDEDERETVSAALSEAGVSVSAIGSPIGKVPVTDEFGPHCDRFKVALDRAEEFEADAIRLFSFWMPEDEDPATYRDVVLGRMETFAELAERRDITLLHENERNLYGDTPSRCRDILESVDSPALGAIFDPANFLLVGVEPFPRALFMLVEHVEAIHVKDVRVDDSGTETITPAGDGDARFPDLFRVLADRGFRGVASLEPHLSRAGEKGGFSGPGGFRTANNALEKCVTQADVAFE